MRCHTDDAADDMMNHLSEPVYSSKSVPETEQKFIDVLLQLLGRYTMKSATNELFEIADHDINQR